jgi:Acetyltransferase (GNAT) family
MGNKPPRRNVATSDWLSSPTRSRGGRRVPSGVRTSTTTCCPGRSAAPGRPTVENRSRPLSPDVRAGTGELDALYVAPAHWRQGIGGLLQDAALVALVDAGFASAILWVLSKNRAARAFYERTGWTADGAEKTEQRRGALLHQVRYGRPLFPGREAEPDH